MSNKIETNTLSYVGEIGNASDGYHTFNELYEHRHVLFLALCQMTYLARQDRLSRTGLPWMANFHSDGTMFDGWFIAGIGQETGRQITYHIPMRYWDDFTHWCGWRERAPEWDGHTPNDVLERLRKL